MLQEYFKLNNVEDISAETLWAAHKAFIRGEIIQIATQTKQERKADIEQIEKNYIATKRILSGTLIAQINKARLELNLSLMT